MLPLEGIKILDLTNLLPGPFATLIFSDLGAEVIKIEKPETGDYSRSIAGLFNSLNRGKKSVVLNLKTDTDKYKLLELIWECDVLVESFRPGVMARLGFSKEIVLKENEKIIYCSISGYGQDGPYKNMAGHDVNYLAVSGALSISGEPNGHPGATGGIQVADLGSSLYAANSVLAALFQRHQTGKGTYIDVSMTDCSLALMSPRINEYYNRNKPSKKDFMSRGGYGAYQTKDQKYISIGCVEDHFWKRICHVLNLEDLYHEERYNSWHKRMIHAEKINKILQEKFLMKSCSEWIEILTQRDIPCSKVNFIDDLADDPHFKHRNLIDKTKNNYIIRYPVKFDDFEVKTKRDIPALDEHNSLI